MTFGDWIGLLVAGIVLIPFSVLILETLAALLPSRRNVIPMGPRPSCCLLIPAHDEEAGIADTLGSLLPQLATTDRLVVIADNCQDNTAPICRSLGVEVLERNNPEQRGKGFALDYGLQYLQTKPPEVVVIVDADCRLEPGTIDVLVRLSVQTNSPVQGIYLEAGKTDNPRRQLAQFGFCYKNEVRPRGLFRLHLPCLLTGTGMAFPWNALQKVSLGSGNIVEDMQLGIDLAIQGYSPQLAPEARLFGFAAPTDQAAMKQRTRWEHGHVRTLCTQVPRLVWQSIRQRRMDLLGLGLELSVPPLSLLFVLWGVVFVGATLWWGIGAGSAVPIWMLLLGLGGLGLTIFLAWAKYGRGILPVQSLLLVPIYIGWKLPIYLKLVRTPEKEWVRTDRSGATVSTEPMREAPSQM